MKKRSILAELLGWYGVIAILLAYAMLSFGAISSDNFIFQILNGTGALGIVYVSIKNRDYQPVVLNIIWAIIALIAIVNIIRL